MSVHRPIQLLRASIAASGLMLALGAAAHHEAAPAQAQSQDPTEAYQRVATWQSTEEPAASGRFKGPWGVDVDDQNRILVADRAMGSVHVLDRFGAPLDLWGLAEGFGAPRDVAAGSNVIYVSDINGQRILLVDPSDGSLQDQWPLAGDPAGLALDEAAGRLYVTRGESADIVILDLSGQTLGIWDAEASTVAEPWGIDVGPDGRVYVCDIGGGAGQAVAVLEQDGTFVRSFPVNLDGASQAPLDVAVDEDGDIFIVTELAVFRLRPDGSAGSPTDRTPGGRGIATGPGSGLVSTLQDFRQGFTGVRHYRDRRATLLAADNEWGGPFSPLGTIEGPRRISANVDDWLFILDTWPRVQGWMADGSPTAQFGVGGLHDIAAGRRGSVFTIVGRRMNYWDSDGNMVYEWEPPGSDPDSGNPFSWLTLIDTFDLSIWGNAALVFDMGDQRLYVVDFSGNPVAEWAVSPPDGFLSIADAALAEELVYLLNRQTDRLEARRMSDGRLLDSWALPGRPLRLDVGPQGNIYTLLREGWVLKYAPDGSLMAAFPVGDPNAEGRLPSASDLTAGPGGRVYVGLDDRHEINVFEPDPESAAPKLPTFSDRCDLRPDKTASPGQVALGFSVGVELTIEGECPLADGRNDIMLLVDTSGSMSGPKMSAARTAALEFVGQLDYSRNQVGLITFSTEVEMVQELSSNPRQLLRAIPSLGDDGATNMLEAMYLAADEFASPRARPEARQVIILLTDGRPSGGAGEIQFIANQYREDGNPQIYTIGLGLDVASTFLRQVATAPNYYFEAPTEYELSKIYDVIAQRVRASVLMEQVTVTDILPANMRYREGSAQPPAAWDAANRTLTWTLNKVSPGGMRLRYRVIPTQQGLHPTNVSAVAEYVDGLSVPGSLTFPVPEVQVNAASVFRIHLPILFKEKCPEVRTDAVLVIDTSTSMREAPGGGETKLDAAKRAARSFLDQLSLPEDRVALVAFNGEAGIVEGLSGDQRLLAEALDRLPEGTGTRMDLGLEAAIRALDAREPGRVPAIVLLTDGQQSGTGPSAPLEMARQARDAGFVIFTIGLGGDADMSLLRQIAGDPARAYAAPSEAQLAEIYRTIAALIPCR